VFKVHAPVSAEEMPNAAVNLSADRLRRPEVKPRVFSRVVPNPKN